MVNNLERVEFATLGVGEQQVSAIEIEWHGSKQVENNVTFHLLNQNHSGLYKRSALPPRLYPARKMSFLRKNAAHVIPRSEQEAFSPPSLHHSQTTLQPKKPNIPSDKPKASNDTPKNS